MRSRSARDRPAGVRRGSPAAPRSGSPGRTARRGREPARPLASPADASFARGEDALRRGDFAAAAASFSDAAALDRKDGRTGPLGESLLRFAEAQQLLGGRGEALTAVREALALAAAAGNGAQIARARGALGGLLVELGANAQARSELEAAVAAAQAATLPGVAAVAQNNLGNLFARQSDPANALTAYAQARTLAEQAGDPALAARAQANAARASVDRGELDAALAALDDAATRARGLPTSFEKAYLLINIARSTDRLRAAHPSERKPLLLRSHALLVDALAVGGGDRRRAVAILGAGLSRRALRRGRTQRRGARAHAPGQLPGAARGRRRFALSLARAGRAVAAAAGPARCRDRRVPGGARDRGAAAQRARDERRRGSGFVPREPGTALLRARRSAAGARGAGSGRRAGAAGPRERAEDGRAAQGRRAARLLPRRVRRCRPREAHERRPGVRVRGDRVSDPAAGPHRAAALDDAGASSASACPRPPRASRSRSRTSAVCSRSARRASISSPPSSCIAG